MNIEQLTRHRAPSPQCFVYEQFELVVNRTLREGELTRDAEACIIAAMTHQGQPNANACRLFRCLQEQVWDGALKLDSSQL